MRTHGMDERATLLVPCPSCGRPFVDGWTIEEQIVATGLTPIEAEIVRVLARSKGHWITCDRIADFVYAADPNGGPENGANCIASHLWKIRKKLTRFTIEGRTKIGVRMVLRIESSRFAGARLVEGRFEQEASSAAGTRGKERQEASSSEGTRRTKK